MELQGHPYGDRVLNTTVASDHLHTVRTSSRLPIRKRKANLLHDGAVLQEAPLLIAENGTDVVRPPVLLVVEKKTASPTSCSTTTSSSTSSSTTSKTFEDNEEQRRPLLISSFSSKKRNIKENEDHPAHRCLVSHSPRFPSCGGAGSADTAGCSASRRSCSTTSISSNNKRKNNKLTTTTTKHEITWATNFKKLAKYKEAFGNCIVPQTYEPDLQLGRWVHQQRIKARTGQMPTARVQKLDTLGFVWCQVNEMWFANYYRLKEYKAKHSNCLVPRNYTSDQQLGKWVNNQRHRRLKLSKERAKLLDEVGFAWSIKTKGSTTATSGRSSGKNATNKSLSPSGGGRTDQQDNKDDTTTKNNKKKILTTRPKKESSQEAVFMIVEETDVEDAEIKVKLSQQHPRSPPRSYQEERAGGTSKSSTSISAKATDGRDKNRHLLLTSSMPGSAAASSFRNTAPSISNISAVSSVGARRNNSFITTLPLRDPPHQAVMNNIMFERAAIAVDNMKRRTVAMRATPPCFHGTSTSDVSDSTSTSSSSSTRTRSRTGVALPHRPHHEEAFYIYHHQHPQHRDHRFFFIPPATPWKPTGPALCSSWALHPWHLLHSSASSYSSFEESKNASITASCSPRYYP